MNAALVSKGEKHADLCPKCLPRVQEFIASSSVVTEVGSDVERLKDAIDRLKGAGFVIYKKKIGGQKK